MKRTRVHPWCASRSQIQSPFSVRGFYLAELPFCDSKGPKFGVSVRPVPVGDVLAEPIA